jgi:hypothetical protein
LPSGVVDEIVMRGDGVPLFIEELTKACLEDRAGKIGTHAHRRAVRTLRRPSRRRCRRCCLPASIGAVAPGTSLRSRRRLAVNSATGFWRRSQRSRSGNCAMHLNGWSMPA